jgi:hypothetical protein
MEAGFPQFAEIVAIATAAALPAHRQRRRARLGGLTPSVPRGHENRLVDLARIAWLATVLACLIAVLILVLDGYYGYAGVTFAVAISAAINLR